MPVPVAEITDVSRLLMAAIGYDNKKNDKEDDEDYSDDNQNSDSSDEENDHITPIMIERTNTIMDYTSTFDSENTSASLSTDNSTNSKYRKSKSYFYFKYYFIIFIVET